MIGRPRAPTSNVDARPFRVRTDLPRRLRSTRALVSMPAYLSPSPSQALRQPQYPCAFLTFDNPMADHYLPPQPLAKCAERRDTRSRSPLLRQPWPARSSRPVAVYDSGLAAIFDVLNPANATPSSGRRAIRPQEPRHRRTRGPATHPARHRKDAEPVERAETADLLIIGTLSVHIGELGEQLPVPISRAVRGFAALGPAFRHRLRSLHVSAPEIRGHRNPINLSNRPTPPCVFCFPALRLSGMSSRSFRWRGRPATPGMTSVF